MVANAAQPLSKQQVKELVMAVADPLSMLAAADPDVRAQIYRDLGLRLTYQPAVKKVLVDALPQVWGTARVGEGT